MLKPWNIFAWSLMITRRRSRGSGLVGRYEPDERGQYTDMPDPSKSPQFLDDCLHRSDLSLSHSSASGGRREG